MVSVTVYSEDDREYLSDALDLCREYEQLLSKTVEGSDVWRINHAGGTPTEVEPRTAELIETALYYSELSGGAFDITIAPLTALWDFKSDNPSLPKESDIEDALPLVGYRKVELDGNTVTLQDKMEIDLGAIAKGYIADRLSDYFKENGVERALINLGGNIVTVGEKANGKWSIGVQVPFEDRNVIEGVVRTGEGSVVTSGIYERYFKVSDTVYHHILNPETGYPATSDLLSVTVISEKSVDGDALATALFLLGMEEGKQLIESMDGFGAVLISENGEATVAGDVDFARE
ncbi:MAG: FAD:protein FMN transferase [Oscillospiraceae bacterium]|nr:FAD:protein FMN transferase [Oscillospiraceae bacterium]